MLNRLFLVAILLFYIFLILVTLYEENRFEKKVAFYYTNSGTRIARLLIKDQLNRLSALAKEISRTGKIEEENLKELDISYALIFEENRFLKGLSDEGKRLAHNPLRIIPKPDSRGFVKINGTIYIFASKKIHKTGNRDTLVLLSKLDLSGFKAFGILSTPPGNMKPSGSAIRTVKHKNRVYIVLSDISGAPLVALEIKPPLSYIFHEHDKMVLAVFLLTLAGATLSSVIIYKILRDLVISDVENLSGALRRAGDTPVLSLPELRTRELIQLADTIKWLIDRLKESEYIFQKTATLMPVAIVVYKQKPVYANREALRIFGEDLLNRSVIEMTDPKYRQKMQIIKKKRIEEGEFFTANYVIKLLTKERTVLRVISTTIFYQGEIAGLSMFIDITEPHRIREFYSIVNRANDILIKSQKENEKELLLEICSIIHALEEIEHVSLLKNGEAVGFFGEKLSATEICTAREKRIKIISTETSSTAYLPVVINSDVEYVLCIHSNIPNLFTENISSILDSLRANLTIAIEKLRYHKHLRHTLFHDTLTGLKNLNSLKRDLKKLKEGTLIYINIRNFTTINQVYGYSFADKLLKSIGSTIEDITPNEVEVYRLHGDKFALLSKRELDRSKALSLSNQITEILKNYEIEDRQITISIDIGITSIPSLVDTAEELIESAETALAEAKIRKSITFYSKEMKRITIENLELESYLKQAIKESLFTFCYQPILNLNSSRIDKAEALIRLKHPELGSINPERFIQIAEQSNLINDITLIVINQAIREIAPLNIGVSINLSARDLESKGVIDALKKMLVIYSRKNVKISVELTERDAMSSFNFAKETIKELKAFGAEVEIDDFGIGYSALDRIMELNFDVLKIDKSLISQINRNPKANQAIKYIIELAHSLGAMAQAEGVEADYQFDFLKAAGCDFIQGYLISKPLTIAELKAFLNGRYHLK